MTTAALSQDFGPHAPGDSTAPPNTTETSAVSETPPEWDTPADSPVISRTAADWNSSALTKSFGPIAVGVSTIPPKAPDSLAPADWSAPVVADAFGPAINGISSLRAELPVTPTSSRSPEWGCERSMNGDDLRHAGYEPRANGAVILPASCERSLNGDGLQNGGYDRNSKPVVLQHARFDLDCFGDAACAITLPALRAELQRFCEEELREQMTQVVRVELTKLTSVPDAEGEFKSERAPPGLTGWRSRSSSRAKYDPSVDPPERQTTQSSDVCAFPRMVQNRRPSLSFIVKSAINEALAGRRDPEEQNHVGDEIFSPVHAGGGIKLLMDVFVSFLIVVNAVILAFQYEHQGYVVGTALGAIQETGSWTGADAWFDGLEHTFNIIFIVECLLRMCIYRIEFLHDWTNIFDFVLVVVNSLYLYILEPLSTVDGVNVSLLRFARILKGFKVLRVGRLMKVVRELRILLAAIHWSMYALGWSVVLLSVIIIIAGIFMCHMLSPFIIDTEADEEVRMWVWKYYGSASRSMYTMFEVTMSGCWPNYARHLIESVSPWYGAFFFMYVSIVVFAVIRVITAIFLKETLNAANNDAEMAVQEHMRIKKKYASKLRKVFDAADTSGDGAINMQEFMDIVNNPKVRTWLQVLEVEVHEAESLFKLMDDGDGLLDYDEFMDGITRVKGHARSVDLIAVQAQLAKVLRYVESLALGKQVRGPLDCVGQTKPLG